MSRRRLCLGFGILLLALGIFLPDSLNTPLPQSPDLPPAPLWGFWLLRGALILDGVALLWLGFRRQAYFHIGAAHRLSLRSAPAEAPDSRGKYALLLAGATCLGLGLRLASLTSDLWLDELTPLLVYSDASPWQIFISYFSSNNHLLHTLMVKMSVAILGEHEWSVRLPAVIFGTATIPVIYWVARQAMSRLSSLCTALLLAVSYHHVFFSQNARAYSAYVFFSLVASVLFVRGLREDRRWMWAFYVATMVLNFASILISAFVFAGHIVVGTLALVSIRRRRQSFVPMLRRLLAVFGITGFLGLHVYVAVLPQMYVVMNSVYASSYAGFAPFSMEFVAEIARGLSAGFGTGLLFGAVPFLAIAAAGCVLMIKRNWAIALALTAPGLLQASVMAARGLVFSPRFFILALPLAILVAVRGVEAASAYVARAAGRGPAFASASSVVLVVLLSVVSLASLPHYYTVPKQSYRRSIEYVEAARQLTDVVIVIHLAESGYRYYGQRQAGPHARNDYHYVRSVAALDEVLARNRDRRSWLVVTFQRALRINLPDLDARVRRDWVVAQEFPATIGDGQITVWRERQ